MPLPRTAQSLKQCQNCYKPDSKETPLMSCSQCKRAHYCSRECQKAHWKDHKAICKINRDTRDDMKEDPEPAATSLLGVSIADLEVKMKKWIQTFRPLLTVTVMNALELRSMPESCLTHTLYIELSPNFTAENVPRKDSQLQHAFKLDDAEVFLIKDFLDGRPEWEAAFQTVLDRVKTTRNQDPHNNVGPAIVVVVIPAIRVMRFVPLGIQCSAAELPPTNPDWKRDLEVNIDRGTLI